MRGAAIHHTVGPRGEKIEVYMPKQLSDREIDAILFKLRERLGFKEREAVKALLKDARGGGLYREELKKDLRRLRADHQISSGDSDAIEQAIFGE